MQLFGLNITKAKEEYKGRNFSEEDREKATAIRQMNAKLKAVEKEKALLEKQNELDELKEELEYEKQKRRERFIDVLDSDDEEETDLNKMLLSLLAPHIPKLLNSSIVSPLNPSETNNPVISNNTTMQNLDDEELLNLKKDIPKKYLKLAKSMSESNIQMFLKNQFPLWNDDTLSRAVAMLKTG